MKRFASHLYAICLAALAMIGITRMPPIHGWNVRTAFTFAWLSLAVFALLAQMQRAKLVGGRASRRPVQQKIRRRGV